MENKENGFSLGTVLTIIFVILKLCKVIEWNWWWVFSPILIESGIVLLIIFILWLVNK